MAELVFDDLDRFVTYADKQFELRLLAGCFADSRLEPDVPSRAVAEEVVQDTWMGVLRGIGSFEGRSSLRTWLFRILVNRARTSGVREHRHVSVDPTEPAVSPDRFDGSGAWAEPVTPWESDVDDRLVAAA